MAMGGNAATCFPEEFSRDSEGGDVMLLLNFSHPFSAEQLEQIAQRLEGRMPRVIEVRCQLDPSGDFCAQMRSFVDDLKLDAATWQTERLLVNLPSLSVIAAAVLAELHGRAGYFPPVVRMRPVPGAVPPRYEVAEIVSLQDLRDTARRSR